MGLGNALNTLMNTAYQLLTGTVFYIMAIAVIAGAVSGLLTEFGVVRLLNKLLSPLMGPLFGMPGASALGMVSTYLSDNPAILTLADDKGFRRFFKAYQIPALTNLGTAFGMGLIVTSFTLGMSSNLGHKVWIAALCGNLGAIIGAIISTRIMLFFMKRAYGPDKPALEEDYDDSDSDKHFHHKGFLHVLDALMEGGKKGVDMGLAIIPGVLIITTAVILITFGPGPDGYTGAANQGVPILPWLAEKIHWVFEWLFGFKDMRLIAFPMTALGSVGASLGLLNTYNEAGILNGNAIAVFTAIGMCWSGFLSTHTAMLDSLGFRKAISKALGAHTVAGLCAGIIAHFVYLAFSLL